MVIRDSFRNLTQPILGALLPLCMAACGEISNRGDSQKTVDIANVQLGLWSMLPLDIELQGRYQHVALGLSDKVLIWGGADGSDLPLADGALIQPETMQVTKMASGPSARIDPAAIVIGNKVYLHGGCQAKVEEHCKTTVDDGYIYSPDADNWQKIATEGSPQSLWRPAHAEVNGSWVIWGGGMGADNQARALGAIYHPESNSWSALASEGQPQPLMAAKAVGVGQYFFVFGGKKLAGDRGYPPFNNHAAVYDTQKQIWLEVDNTHAPLTEEFFTVEAFADHVLIHGLIYGTSRFELSDKGIGWAKQDSPKDVESIIPNRYLNQPVRDHIVDLYCRGIGGCWIKNQRGTMAVSELPGQGESGDSYAKGSGHLMYMSITATKHGFFLYGGLKDDLKTASDQGAFLDFREVRSRQKPSIYDEDFVVKVEAIDQPTVDKEIILAAKEGNLKRVEDFFNNRSDVNLNGATLLHWAANLGNTDLLDALLPHFEDINLLHTGRGVNALYDSGRAPTTDAMKLLLQHGADPYVGCGNGSAIDSVVRWAKPAYLGVLIRHGIDVNKPAGTCFDTPEANGLVIHTWVREGQDPMDQDIQIRHDQIGEQLYLAGIHLHSEIKSLQFKSSVLAQASRFDNYQDVEWLVYRGGDHVFVDHKGNTAEGLASDKQAYRLAFERGIARRR